MDPAIQAAVLVVFLPFGEGMDHAGWFPRSGRMQFDRILVAEESLQHFEASLHRSAMTAGIRWVRGSRQQGRPFRIIVRYATVGVRVEGSDRAPEKESVLGVPDGNAGIGFSQIGQQ